MSEEKLWSANICGSADLSGDRDQGVGGVPGRAAGAPKKILRLNDRFKQVSIKVFEHFQRGCKGIRFFRDFKGKMRHAAAFFL